MRMVLEVDGEARCCRRVGWVLEDAVVLGWTARRVAVAWLVGFERMRWCWGGRRGVFVVAWLRIFFIFCLRRGGGYMYS